MRYEGRRALGIERCLLMCRQCSRQQVSPAHQKLRLKGERDSAVN